MAAPQRIKATLVDNTQVAPHTFVLRFEGCEALAGALPGQFVMLRGEDWGTDPLLPRAFSILAVGSGGDLDVLAKEVGKATALMARAPVGAEYYVLGPLGTGFPDPTSGGCDWLVAGGVGLAPLMMYATRAAERGLAEQVTMFYGGRTSADLVLGDEVAATGARVVLATEDGSRGRCGYVTAAVEDALAEGGFDSPPTLLACGPGPMLAAVARLAHQRGIPAYLSLEGEMACGIGACLACAVPCSTRSYRYTCIEGPVFPLAELAGPYAPPANEEGRRE